MTLLVCRKVFKLRARISRVVEVVVELRELCLVVAEELLDAAVGLLVAQSMLPQLYRFVVVAVRVGFEIGRVLR